MNVVKSLCAGLLAMAAASCSNDSGTKTSATTELQIEPELLAEENEDENLVAKNADQSPTEFIQGSLYSTKVFTVDSNVVFEDAFFSTTGAQDRSIQTREMPPEISEVEKIARNACQFLRNVSAFEPNPESCGVNRSDWGIKEVTCQQVKGELIEIPKGVFRFGISDRGHIFARENRDNAEEQPQYLLDLARSLEEAFGMAVQATFEKISILRDSPRPDSFQRQTLKKTWSVSGNILTCTSSHIKQSAAIVSP